jgi:cytochrome c biogenesis protein CcmG/thiol:disulfide interchange protein DsbE
MHMNFYRCSQAVAVTLLALGAGACGAGLGSGGDAEHPAEVATLLGNPAPGFTVKLLARGGARLSLDDLRGQVALVDFWGTYCAPCKEAMPKLQALSAKYSSAGLRVIGISEDEPEDKDKIMGFAASRGAKFAIAWDEDRSIAQQYKPDTMPSSYIIDRRGVVRYVHVGFRSGDEAKIEKEVQGLLAQ